MPITRKQISAAASTSNPPARIHSASGAAAIKPNLPVSDDDLFEQSAIQVSSASRQTRTINHQIPKEMRKQLHGAFKAAAAAASNNAENSENVGDCENRAQNRSAKQAPMVQARTLVKRSSTAKPLTPAIKQPSILLAERKENVFNVVDNDVDDTNGDDAIFDVPVTSPPRLTITINLSSAKNNGNSANKTSVNTMTAHNTVSTPSKTAPPIKQQQSQAQMIQLATPSKLLNQVTSHQILAEVRKTPLTMAEKKRRQSIVVSKGPVLDKSTRTAISALKPTAAPAVNTAPAIDLKPAVVVVEDESLVNDDIVNDAMFIDILGSDSDIKEEEAPTIELVEEKENAKKKRKQFIRNQATESAPPDILSTVDKVDVAEIVDKTPEKAIAIVDAIVVEAVPLSAAAVDPVVDVSCMHVPPPPKLEDLETLDPELYVKLKCGSLKDDLSAPFISETDRVDIENFLESFTSPELTKNLLPVAIIGEGTFSTVYKVIDKNFYECDNSAWVEYSRQCPLDWLRLWRWVYAQEPKDRLVLIKDGRKCVDRNGRSLSGVSTVAGITTVNTVNPVNTVNTVNTTDSTVTTATAAVTPKQSTKGRLPGLLRRYLLEWAMRSLDSLQGGQEISESLLTSITPRVLQAAMLRFRPFFTALKRINATSSPQRILDEISFLKHLGGKNNVVPLINGMRCEDQVLVTFPYFYSEDFRVSGLL